MSAMAGKVAPGGLPSGLDAHRIVDPERVRGPRRPPAQRADETGVEAPAVDERLRVLAARVDAGQRALDAVEHELRRQLGALDALAAGLARQAGALRTALDEGT
jgi:hypothetical protein